MLCASDACLARTDLYEIRPEVPYSKDDLNWNDKTSRSSVEMNDKSCRPGLLDHNAEIEMYDLIFLGYAGVIIGLN